MIFHPVESLKCIIRIISLTFLLSVIIILQGFSQHVTFNFNTYSIGKPITNKGTDINFWSMSSWQNPLPAHYFSTNFPFVKRVQLMAAIGGNSDRDLFKNPSDHSVLDDYNFNALFQACQNIIDQGLKPMISLSWVPQKFSSKPAYGAFDTNLRPPDDFGNWYIYITAITQALADKFGNTEVNTWSWCVGVEFENKDWFDDGINSNLTKEAFYRLYDYAVAALDTVLGAENVNIGVHSMTCSEGYWDERQFIDHCADGNNYATGKKGTRLDFYQISYYDVLAAGFNGENFLKCTAMIKDHLEEKGFGNIPVGVAEGRVLNGWDNKPLNPREVLHPIQGSMDAKSVVLMVENNIDWFSHWGCEADRVNNLPVNLVGANVYQLAYKMTGSRLIGKNINGIPVDPDDELNGMAGINENDHKLYIFLYSNNGDRDATTSEPVQISIANVEYASDTADNRMCSWILDASHGNFWNEWYKAQIENGLTDADFDWSRYSLGKMSQAGWNAWGQNQVRYQQLSMPDSTVSDYIIDNNKITLNVTLAPHSVLLLEFSNVKQGPVTALSSENVEDEDQLSVYPNPLMDELTAEYTLNTKSRVGIQLIDPGGQSIELFRMFQDSGKHKEIFNLSKYHLASGLYILRLSTGNNVFSRKVILGRNK